MSASSRPTSAPDLARAAARLTATVDLPTPPLPLATAMVCLTPGRMSAFCWRMKPGRTLAVIFTSTAVTPARAPTASSAMVLNRSRTGQAGVVSSKVKATRPSSDTRSSLIIPRLTTSRPRSGSTIVASAPRISFSPRTSIHGDSTQFEPQHPVGSYTFSPNVRALPDDLLGYYTGPASDVYFQRAAQTLAAAGVDPVVTMEYFPDRDGLLCGMNDVLEILRRALG